MGCQCYSCINDTEVDIMEKHMHSLVQYRNPAYFNEHISVNESASLWNEHYVYCGLPVGDGSETLLKVYDPLRGSYKENSFTKRLREGKPFFFTHYPEQDNDTGEAVQFNFEI